MLEQTLSRLNRWALRHVGREWVDYVASNTMTDFNRHWNSFLWTYELQAIVVRVKDEAPGVKTITLMPNQHWKGLQPGQHVGLSATIDGQHHTRFYSVSPMEDDCFSITVKRTGKGVVSGWAHTQLKPGMTVEIGQAQGHFCYRQQSKVLFISAGSGITPCHSMVKALLAQERRPDIAAYAQFTSSQDVIFADDLRHWPQHGVRLATALSRPTPADAASSHYSPVLDAGSIDTLFPDFREREIYLCGPQGFMDKVATVLQDKGFDMDKLHSERFTAHDVHALTPSDFKTAQAEIYFQHLDKRIALSEADEGLTLMQIAERHQVHLESGCRQGMCGTCKLTLREGEVSGNKLGNAVYLCTSYPASNIVVLDA